MTPAPPSPLGSIVIPAFNEAATIARTLRALYGDVDPGSFEVIVACNGCTDQTVQVARATGFPMIVLDLPAVGKIGAIRAAEEVASVLPRLYLDADTEMSGESACAVLLALGAGAVAARPPVTFDTAASSRTVARFYRVRARLGGIADDLCGAGVYGLSEAGRRRFGTFPDVVGDDLFVARIVTPDEVCIVDCPPAVVRVPLSVGSLLKTLGRVYRGNRQLRRLRPDLDSSTTGASVRGLVGLARDPRQWFAVASYATIVTIGRARARRSRGGWERDDSSRRTAGAF